MTVVVLEALLWIPAACIIVPMPFGKGLKNIHWFGSYAAIAILALLALLAFCAVKIRNHPEAVRVIIISLVPAVALLLVVPVALIFAVGIL